jgi:hypothetical protein
MPSLAATLRQHGFRSLLSRGRPHIAGYLFQHTSVYPCEHTMREGREAGFLPCVRDFTGQSKRGHEAGGRFIAG